MKPYFVCRILKHVYPIKYKHVNTCECKIYSCIQNNTNLKIISDAPYIVCKLQKAKQPDKYLLSESCNCKTNECKQN